MSEQPITSLGSARARRLLESSLNRPHEGRVYDYYLGGRANWAVDQAFAREQIRKVPDLPWAARQNRKFLGRAVSHMLACGIRQFVDIGSGLPTEGNVHEVVDREAPGEDVRVVYVDHDSVATAHAQLLLERAGSLRRHQPITGDLLDGGRLWQSVLSTGLIDPKQPIGLLLVAVLHFVPDDQAASRAVAFWREAVPSGSFLAISHASVDGMSQQDTDHLKSVLKDYDRATSQAVPRTRDELAGFFGDWTVIEPGVVWTADWYVDGAVADSVAGDSDSSRSKILAAVGRKP